MKRCFSCNTVIESDDRPARSDTCPGCDADVKVCPNCAFFDEGAYNECHEPQAERIVDKESSNFCEYFSFTDSVDDKTDKTKEELETLQDLKDLFKDSD